MNSDTTTIMYEADGASMVAVQSPASDKGVLEAKQSSPKLGVIGTIESAMRLGKSSRTRLKDLKAEAASNRNRSFTLSASASNIMVNDRRAQFARERSNSVPHNPAFNPKSIDEVWDEVHANWNEYSQKDKLLGSILYKKGIPNSRRGIFWTLLSKSIPKTDLLKCSQGEVEGTEHSCIYKRLLEMDTVHEQQIRADITRTFPSEKSIYAPEFQQSLLNVLKAFSLYDPEVGYCQGLSFVAALLLMAVKEEQAFFMLIRLLKGHNLRSFYTEDMRGVRMRMFQMNKITQTLFPLMYKHMEELGVSIAVVTTPWFMTAFGYQLPLDVALRVTDVMLYEGIPALFRIALAILVLCEKEILELGVDGVMDYFRSDLREKFKDPQLLMTTAFNVNVSLSQLEKMETEFLQNELTADHVESEFDQKSAEDILARQKTFKFSQVLVDCHELKERLVKRDKEYEDLSKQFETYQKKAETEKIAVISRLGEVLDKLNNIEAENAYLTSKLGSTEDDLQKFRKKNGELAECNSVLAEEIYRLKKKGSTG